ncbi:Short-chain dehydrogenase/reductase SDR [Trypanosoma melophagium]|uniref:Short-chain dehydrogenase/reductase SDR n=1 Tax=Trypanosoma melophagium TaxID=715481 RepID=UPI00351A9834|nr:Short-chain dehydrogenase/reductase SDR [Trypanosoma melophagium]
MTLAEHEARWGFTLDELHAATKVVRTLFHNPSLFVGDTYLCESRLYTMIARDRKSKHENRDVYKAIMSEEKSRRKRFKRMQDIEAIRRTEMKRERDEALNSLMLPPQHEQKLLTDKATESRLLCNHSDTVGHNEEEEKLDQKKVTDGSLSARDQKIARLIGAFENLIHVLVLNSPTLRNVSFLRQCGGLKSASQEVNNALQHITPVVDALRTFELVLTEGVIDDRFVPRNTDNTEIAISWSADVSLGFFIARRLYSKRSYRNWGQSPVVVQTCPPISEDEEPDTYCIFDDVQLYTAMKSIPKDEVLQLNLWAACHTCRVRYNQLHPYYYSLCHLCGEYNFNKRLMTRDLRGKVVLLTGCRIKIGFAMALSLVRCGVCLVGTARFVHEALARFQEEIDYEDWKDRLHFFSLDLQDMWVVTLFCAFVTQRFPKLFAIINNAAQTIARTREYNAHVRQLEEQPPQDLHHALYQDETAKEWHLFFLSHSSVTIGEPLSIECHPHEQQVRDTKDITVTTNGNNIISHTGNEQHALVTTNLTINNSHLRVFDRYDTLAEESDHREKNSWVMRLADVQGSETAETMVINALLPLIINSKLKRCLLNREGDPVPNEARFIMNVSAMEGQFYRFKQVAHPHTNMVKAALNMMTRTSGEDYAQDGIYMNSVDTGWITDESPKAKKERRAEQVLLCPLDEVDAAARRLDLIYTNSKEYGKFFKDFKEIPWQ